MKNDLTSLEQALLSRKLAYNADRIKKIESFFKGVPLGTVRFADASIIDAKIVSLAAEKIATGTISVGEEILVNDGSVNRIQITHTLIAISKPGVEVTTADIKDLVILNQENAHKLSHKGYVTSGSYTHGLGARPVFFAFQTDSISSPTYFQLTKEARASTSSILNIPNPSYLVVFRERI